ncbi:MAG: glycine betaine/L-proline ABC transporter ATP-binding protein [Pseudomonadota bacterium]|nr:glycine betaine/L-proline ABC transporter ATP-binding protein [Pseudomonadota bacterium]
MPKKSVTISCKNVWKLYGSDPARFLANRNYSPSENDLKQSQYIAAVFDASIDVFEGEILVIMGLSGSGKSSLVRCMTRLVEPTSGEIHFEGSDLLKATEKELIEIRRHKMGMVFQNFALMPHRNVLENIAFPLEVQGVSREKREERAIEIIDLVGLKGREKYYPRELSGGQQQRVGLARSLAVEPNIWFLDEPFSALDPLIRKEMQNEFLRLQNLLNKTIVFITHDFDEAIRLADRIAIMYEGRIVQVGNAEELITNPANEYVAEFTRDIPRAKLLSVGSIMQPAKKSTKNKIVVNKMDKISSVAPSIISSNAVATVVDESGDVCGQLTKDQIVDILFADEKTND